MVKNALKSAWSIRRSNKVYIGENVTSAKPHPPCDLHQCFDVKTKSELLEPEQDRINLKKQQGKINLVNQKGCYGDKVCVNNCHYNTTLKKDVKDGKENKTSIKTCSNDNKSKKICQTPKTVRRRPQSFSEIQSINTLKDWDVYTMVRKHSEERKHETLSSAKIIFDACVPIELPKYSSSSEVNAIYKTRNRRRNAVHIYDGHELKEQLTYYVVQMQFAVRFGI